MLWVFSEGAWEELLATVKIMNAIPYAKLTPATDRRRVQGVQGPARSGSAGGRVRQGYPAEPAACGNQTQFYNYMGKGKWKVGRGLAEAARGRSRRAATKHGGPGRGRARRALGG